MDPFSLCMHYIAKDEGGYAERKLEGGGAVNLGVTFTEFSAWRQLQGLGVPTFNDLAAMTWDEAEAIYRAHYAGAIHFDQLPLGTCYVVLDSAVNNGVTGAAGILRGAVGLTVRLPSGKRLGWTPEAVLAAKMAPPEELVNKFCDERKRQQSSFANYHVQIRPDRPRTWGSAWDVRVELVRARALAMIEGKTL